MWETKTGIFKIDPQIPITLFKERFCNDGSNFARKTIPPTNNASLRGIQNHIDNIQGLRTLKGTLKTLLESCFYYGKTFYAFTSSQRLFAS